MLPGTALMPATAPELKQAAYDAGVQMMKLVEQGITAKDIVTKKMCIRDRVKVQMNKCGALSIFVGTGRGDQRGNGGADVLSLIHI